MQDRLTGLTEGTWTIAELRSTNPLSNRDRCYYSSSSSGSSSSTPSPSRLPLVDGQSHARSALRMLAMNVRDPQPGNLAILRGEVNIKAPGHPPFPFDGVVDTGAAYSVIPQALVRAYGLSPTSHKTLWGFDGKARKCAFYEVTFSIRDLSPQTLSVPATHRNDVLIGRDLLERCRFVYDGPNRMYSLYEPSLARRMWGALSFRFNRLRDRIIHRKR